MRLLALHNSKSYLRRSLRYAALLTGMVLLGTAGRHRSVRTNDPQLKPIQEMLDAQLPPGTSGDKVKAFLGKQGYAVLPAQKPGTVVAVIPVPGDHEASPATAQVTLYFDANGKLNTFALERALGEDPKQ